MQQDLKAIKLLFPNYECDWARDETWPDFERLMTSLDEATRFQRSYEKLTGTETENWASETKRHLMHQMLEKISELTSAAQAEGLEIIQRFVQAVEQTRDTIISFDWDVLVEIAASDLGIRVRYLGTFGNGLCVAKPHGSINLVDSPKDAYERARQVAINVFGLDEELEYGDDERHVILRARDPRQAWIRQTWAPQESRIIVEPNCRKMYDTHWIEGQWTRALDMARGSDEIIVIGFSLPLADLRPRTLLQLTRLQRPTPLNLLIVDPNASRLCDHYRRLTGLEAKPFDGTLEHWLQRATSD